MSAIQRLAIILTAFLCIGASSGFKTPLFVGVLLPYQRNEFFFSKPSASVVRMAADHINNNQYLLPNHEIVLSVNDSRVRPLAIRRVVVCTCEICHVYVQCDIGLASYQMYRLLSANTTKIALMAAGCSLVTQPLAQSSQYWNVPQVSTQYNTSCMMPTARLVAVL